MITVSAIEAAAPWWVMVLCIAVGCGLIASRARVTQHYEETYPRWRVGERRVVPDRMLSLVTRPIAPVMFGFGLIFIAIGIGGLLLIALGRTT